MNIRNLSNKMKVSFDLDEVLFVNPKTHKTEPELKYPLNKIYRERLRLGTPDLIHELQNRDIEVWVYTSSFRSEFYIKRLFWHYGIVFDHIINGERHLAEVQAGNKTTLPQKLPNKFRIALHVDDEDIVVKQGAAYGFKVYKLEAPDDEWQEKLLNRIEKIQKQLS